MKTLSNVNLRPLFFLAALLAATAARARPGSCWDTELLDQTRLGECSQVIHYETTHEDYTQFITLLGAQDLEGGGSGEPGVDRRLDQDRPLFYEP